ncbi:Hsp33 family molecular chaperone HslO [Endozoicomonas sp. SCSIO W0465]|uniref:Hsp33 family molecular chaperone HslO n=1 Tax=Endozoicomonas sp. SCSIO W0465 TaxID=2918516 RepID=UPI0020753409|nr:Hsp33 family molecular chaperone HslO [Endozoicomonas sp. SCSIO W0465]USE36753.1 Hsp33 family molecular chaperone HslO [Endozoicomonas sp. SCSIO W0465]
MSRTDNAVQRFIFENTDIRGEIVSLNNSYVDALAAHDYPEIVRRLLGELVASVVLLSTTLKFEGLLTLQARGDGPLTLLMVECTDQKSFRAVAQFRDDISEGDLQELLGKASLLITVDPVKGKRYQGIVPLEKETLAASLEDYFAQSVQLQTRLWLACDGQTCGGLLLQALPASVELCEDIRTESWNRMTALAETVQNAELLDLNHETLLLRLFHEETVRIFAKEPVRFVCTCSHERSAKIISTLDRKEIESIVKEEGQVAMDCQFCNHQYVFGKEDIDSIFSEKTPIH